MNIGQVVMALTTFFILVVIFTYFDPVIEDKIYQFGVDKTTSTAGDAILVKYLNAWHTWVPAFIAAILILVVTAGGRQEKGNINI